MNFFGVKTQGLFVRKLPLLKQINRYVDLLAFHENWAEFLSVINAQKCVRNKIQNNSFVTSWSVTAAKIFFYGPLQNKFLRNH